MTDWTSAIAILVAGAILGFMFVYFVKRKPAAAPSGDPEMRDLETKRDALIRRLRELDRNSADERTQLEIETAQVLRQIDEHGRRAPSHVAGGRGRPPLQDTQRATLVGFAWGAGSMLVLCGLAYFVMQSAKPRETVAAPAESSMRAARQPGDPTLQQLEAAVQKSPDDLNMRIALAKAYLERDNLMGVFDQTQYVLARSPNDSRALTYQALVRLAMGQAADAVSMLEKATTTNPDLIDAWVALAWAKMQMGKPKEAEAAMAEAARRHPQDKQRLDQVYAQMKVQAAGGRVNTPASGGPATSPAGAAEVGGPPQGVIHVALEIVPGKPRSGTVFVIARAQGVTAGPPVAVKRLSAALLPTMVDLSSADSMLGQPLPPKVRIEARVDSDGNPLTRDPADPSAVLDGVPIGATVKMKLQ